MKQEVRNFLRNFEEIVQRNSSKLGNELVNIFRNASIGTTVNLKSILILIKKVYLESTIFVQSLLQWLNIK
jgi:hypothetical protein